MIYRTLYDRYRVTTNPGSAIKIKYQGKLNKKDIVELVEVGKEDLYGYIQSFADSVDLNVIIKRFQNGDINALNQREGAYIDVSDCPTDARDMFDMIQKSSDTFASLPTDLQEKFEGFADFMHKVGTEEFDKIISDYDKSLAVSNNESTRSE